MSRPNSPAAAEAGSPRPPLAQRISTPVFAACLTTAIGGAAAPTPLYAIYRVEWGLSPTMLSLVFAIYALGLLGVLLFFGRLSDHLGRKPVILAGLVILIAALVLFLKAEGLGLLLTARAMQGMAAGLLTGALGAAMTETSPRNGPVLTGLSPFLGMAIGAIGAAALASWAPDPMHLPFLCLLIVVVTLMILVLPLPEPLRPEPQRLQRAVASLRPSFRMPPQLVRPFLQLSPANIAGWSLAAFYMSLGPALARMITGSSHPMIGGMTVAAITLGASGAVLASLRMRPERLAGRGALALLLGVILTLSAVQTGVAGLLFLGAATGGAGMGFILRSALTALLPNAAPHERAGVLSLYFTQSYLAFSLPAICAAFLVQAIGLRAATDLFGTVLMLLAAFTLILARAEQRSAAQGCAG